MELAPLGSLRSVLNKTPSAVLRSEKAQLSILKGIAIAMAFLHSKGILHCDLKSDNVPEARVERAAPQPLPPGPHSLLCRSTFRCSFGQTPPSAFRQR